MREELVIDRFLGLNRNVADNAEGQPPAPDEVFNLWPVMQGGLMKFGGAVVTATVTGTVIGFDESGLSTFFTTGALVRRWDEIAGTATSTAQIGGVGTLHVPTIGVSRQYDQQYFKGRDSDIDQDGLLGVTITAVRAITGGSLVGADTYHLFVPLYKVASNGTKVLVDFESIVQNNSTGTAADSIDVTLDPLGTDVVADIYMADLTPSSNDKLFKLVARDVGDPTATSTATITAEAQDAVFFTRSGTGNWLFAGFTGAVAEHNLRYWGKLRTGAGSSFTFGLGVASPEPPGDISTDLHIGYTEQGWYNVFDALYLEKIPAVASLSITHVIATDSNAFGEFGGVLVFCTDEAWVVVGDPAIEGSLGIERFPVTIGADEGVRPVTIGGVIFVVWNGDLYTIAGAQAEKISQPLLEADEDITHLAADPANRCIVVKLSTNARYRYFYEFDFWMRDVAPAIWGTESVVPSDLFSGLNGSYYYFTAAGTSQVATGDIWVVDRTTNDGGTPSMTFRDVDFGDPSRHDMPLDLRVFTDDWPAVTATASDAPRVYYQIAGTETDVDTDTGNTDFVQARLTGDQMYYTFPYHLRAREADFRIRFDGMDLNAQIHPPMQLGFVQGYRNRR